jgi:putative protease
LPFTLEDADGRIIERDRHLLSLKDMNRSAHLEAMMDAGVRSFKIEGRLKDVTYVKNITAYYRQAIDKILARRPEYRRASQGVSTYTFTPQPDKSFNRGFTDYYITGRRTDVTSFATPKSVGEPIGHVKEVGRGFITVSSAKALHNGDGLCYIDERGLLQGFRVNRVEGTRLFLKDMPRTLRARTPLFRNYDQEFERLLSRPSAERRIPVTMRLYEIPFGFALTLADAQGRNATVTLTCDKEPARTEQRAGIETGLAKLGGTILVAEHVDIDFTANWFIPSSVLANARRNLIQTLIQVPPSCVKNLQIAPVQKASNVLKVSHLDYTANIANNEARAYYKSIGIDSCDNAFELTQPKGKKAIMFCKYCIRHELGMCKKKKLPPTAPQYTEPFFLHSMDGKMFELSFNCKDCEMSVWTLS